MTAGVYRIHCRANNSYYVGESYNVSKRIKKHIAALSSGVHENHRLQACWQKYGPDAFDFVPVWFVDGVVSATLNRKAINLLTQRMEATIGFGMIAEGMCLLNIKPFDHWGAANPSTNPEVRSAQSRAATLRWADPQKRAELSAKLRGLEPLKPRNKRGAPSSEVLSARLKERWKDPVFREKMSSGQSGGKSPVARMVRCKNTGDVFVSATSAAKHYGVLTTLLVRAIKNGYKCGGVHWEYANDKKPGQSPTPAIAASRAVSGQP